MRAHLGLLALCWAAGVDARGRLTTPNPRRSPAGHHAIDNRGKHRCGRRGFHEKTALNSHPKHDVVPTYEAGEEAVMAWTAHEAGKVRLSLLNDARDLVTPLMEWTPVAVGDGNATVRLPSVYDPAASLVAWELRTVDGTFWSCADVRVLPPTPAVAAPHVGTYAPQAGGVFHKIHTAPVAAGAHLQVDVTPSRMLPSHHTCHMKVMSALPPHHRVLYDAAGGSRGFSKIFTRDGLREILGTDALPAHLYVRFGCEAVGAADNTAASILAVKAVAAGNATRHDLGVAAWPGADKQLCLRWTQPADAPWAIHVARAEQPVDFDPLYLPVVQRHAPGASMWGADDRAALMTHCFEEPTAPATEASRYHVVHTAVDGATVRHAPVHGVPSNAAVFDGAAPVDCAADMCIQHLGSSRGARTLGRGASTLATELDPMLPMDTTLGDAGAVFSLDVATDNITFVQWMAVSKKGYPIMMAVKPTKSNTCDDVDRIFQDEAMYVQVGATVGGNAPGGGATQERKLTQGKYCVAVKKDNSTNAVTDPVDIKIWGRLGGQNDVQPGARGQWSNPGVVASKETTSWGSDAVGLKLWAAVGGSTDITYRVYASAVTPGEDQPIYTTAEEVRQNQQLVYTQSSLVRPFNRHVFLQFTPQDMPDLGACTSYQVNVVAETPTDAALYAPVHTNPECLRYVPREEEASLGGGSIAAIIIAVVAAVLLIAAFVYREKLPIVGDRFKKAAPKRQFTTPVGLAGDAAQHTVRSDNDEITPVGEDKDPLGKDPLGKSSTLAPDPLSGTNSMRSKSPRTPGHANLDIQAADKKEPLLARQVSELEPVAENKNIKGAASMAGI
eukprot:TRINITY_DN1351_c0_g4_i1.p1 TRINITY_DN1351_c0_g4~~TRINITY_DN1351_c0_g4_i1.p1  ORF type:complete len:841 (+),score=267.61 TRINITY_DN1351_c0_g4_i1:61-2583(+)